MSRTRKINPRIGGQDVGVGGSLVPNTGNWSGVETGQQRIRRLAARALTEGRVERAKGLIQALACVRRAESAKALWGDLVDETGFEEE